MHLLSGLRVSVCLWRFSSFVRGAEDHSRSRYRLRPRGCKYTRQERRGGRGIFFLSSFLYNSSLDISVWTRGGHFLISLAPVLSSSSSSSSLFLAEAICLSFGFLWERRRKKLRRSLRSAFRSFHRVLLLQTSRNEFFMWGGAVRVYRQRGVGSLVFPSPSQPSQDRVSLSIISSVKLCRF